MTRSYKTYNLSVQKQVTLSTMQSQSRKPKMTLYFNILIQTTLKQLMLHQQTSSLINYYYWKTFEKLWKLFRGGAMGDPFYKLPDFFKVTLVLIHVFQTYNYRAWPLFGHMSQKTGQWFKLIFASSQHIEPVLPKKTDPFFETAL